MSAPPCTCAAARRRPRAQAVVNAEIHALTDRGPLDSDERDLLADLYLEWLAADEVGLAA